MDLSDDELRNVVRVLLLVQAAFPAIFLAGMLAANQDLRKSIERARRRLRMGGDVAEDAAKQFMAGFVMLFGLVALVMALFIVPTVELSLYAAGWPASPSDFVALQIGVYTIVWLTLTSFLFVVVPRVR